jgi:signal transduction histidine kinase
MKSIKILFLFFIVLWYSTNDGYCQIKDSIGHYTELIQVSKNSNDLALAYKFFLKKKDEYSDEKSIKKEIYVTQNIAKIQYYLGYLDESERLNVECLELLDLVAIDAWSINSKAKTINDLGIIYRHKKDYKKALTIYNEALSLVKKESEINIILNNMGYVYLQQNDFQKALEYFDLAYSRALKNDDILNVARSLDNLGFTKSKMNIIGAEEDLIEALNIRIKENYDFGIAHSYENLTRHFYALNDSERILLYSDKLIDLANETNNLELLESSLRLKIDVGDDSVSRDHLKIQDSIHDMEETNRSNFNYYVYQYDKKDKALQKSKLQNEREKKVKLIYLFSTLMVLFGSIFFYFILKSKHKKDKLQQVFNTESRISKKVHDEVANDVYQVMTKLQSDKASEEVIDSIEQIYIKTRDISKEHSLIDLESDFQEMLNDLILSFNDVETNIIAQGISKVNWTALSDIKQITIYKVLQELLINMKKHSGAEIVVLTFEVNRKTISVNYSDNGKGCDLKKGLGLQNTENRIASIKGTITFDSEINKGFKTKITI